MTNRIHATTVALGDGAALIRGPSGSGKSDLALRFLSGQGALAGETRSRTLVADDQTELAVNGAELIATCPAPIKGKLEVRGLGIMPIAEISSAARVVLVIDLTATRQDVPRMPLTAETEIILGISVPRLTLDPFEPSAPLKLALALARATA